MPPKTSEKKDGRPPANTLLSFFPVVKHGLPPNVRRPLDTPAPPPRKKPLTAGRTNPPTVQAVPGAANSDFMRRVRPRGVAGVKRAPVLREIVAAPGIREDRDEALTVEDLWRPGSGPPFVDSVSSGDNCTICLQLKSHPVFYNCGHGHCYTCIRIWLEEQWECPECRAIITQEPFRVYAVEEFLARLYGDWDSSNVAYDWSGLTFPVLPSHLVVLLPQT
ncbi:hypothetical protein DFH06DRAFT_1316659 [Mycena polygramma]|nr:hypothetical protein DFH06DRAFT_1316659 [Mycena polygramma]